jgi:uncharacterized protein (DUF1499 family)
MMPVSLAKRASSFATALLLGAVTAFALGVRDGRLDPCPSSPNCVASQADGDANVEPLAFEGSGDAALRRLADAIRGMPRAEVVALGNGYLRAEFTTRLFGWVDDVEAVVDGSANVIHLRSASRTGYWDLGTNRRRVEAIREAFAEASAP